jgi:hypothetical protein
VKSKGKPEPRFINECQRQDSLKKREARAHGKHWKRSRCYLDIADIRGVIDSDLSLVAE